MRRLGGALNLNVHFHCVIPDGVFTRDEGAVRFVPLGPPADSELEAILRRIVLRLLQVLRPRSEALDMEQPDALASAQSEALMLPAASSSDPPRRGRHPAGDTGAKTP